MRFVARAPTGTRFVVGTTNANVMRFRFRRDLHHDLPKTGEHLMPCHDYCGTGHEAMWARVQVIRPKILAESEAGKKVSCVRR